MMYQLSDGSIIDGYSAIEYPAGILRPPLWIQSLSLDEKSALGIHEWTPPAYQPPQVDFVEQKEQALAMVRKQAKDALSPSDWLVIRKAEIGTEIPADWEAYRTGVRSYSNALEAAIEASTNAGQLDQVVTGATWPVDPETALKEKGLKKPAPQSKRPKN